MGLYKRIIQPVERKLGILGLVALLYSTGGGCSVQDKKDPPNESPYFNAPTVYVNGSLQSPEFLGTETVEGIEKELYRVTIDEGDDFVLQLDFHDPEYDPVSCDFLTWTDMPIGTIWDDINYAVECYGSDTSSAGRTEPYIMEFTVSETGNPDKKDYLGVEWVINDTTP